MTDMTQWTAREKRLYIPLLHDVITDEVITDERIDTLPPRVRTAIRDILRPDR